MAAQLTYSTPEIGERVREWATGHSDPETRAEVQRLIDSANVKELEDRFWRTLEFGTGGLRGVVGAGTNRMNRTIVARATQGLANYVSQHQERPGKLRAVVGHDSRHFSRAFAETAAAVLAANGFEVFLSPELRPTPWVSFAVRRLECHTGIMVTASHNPKEYNGYKVYWDDGSQVIPPHDEGIIAEVTKVTEDAQVRIMNYQEALMANKIHLLDKDMDEAYLDAILQQRLMAEADLRKSPIKVVYTPLHGVGGTLAPKALERWGFRHAFFEKDQMVPDGNFPTAASPNPEESAALERAIELAKKVEGDIVLATDPDADRLGIAVRHGGSYQLITGNQLCALLCDYILRRNQERGTLPANPGVVTTIVTTTLMNAVAAEYGAECPRVLTGFKWIADVARTWERTGGPKFLYGTEESYGFLIGDHCRDKDGIVASCLAAEMAAWAQAKGWSVVDYLEQLYLQHGPRLEWQKSVTMKGKEGAEQIKGLMVRLKENPPKAIDDVPVARVVRVDTGEIRDAQNGNRLGEIDLPPSDVVMFYLADGSLIVARPSGTEPKIKFYFFLEGAKQPDMQHTRQALVDLQDRRSRFQSAFLSDLGVL